MYLLWILGWAYLRQNGPNRTHQREKKAPKNVTNDHTKSTSKICRFGDPQQHAPSRALRLRKSFALGLKTKYKPNYQSFHLHSRILFSCSKWAVWINHCSPCEFISCSTLSSFHKSIMDHQFCFFSVLSHGHTASTSFFFFYFKNRLATESAKKC